VTAATPPIRRIRWSKTFRVIPSRYPPIDLFERIADPADWEMLALVEGLTNDRLRDELGDISIVPLNERLSGPGASPIMAAFTHIGRPSRFSNGTFGVYYASSSFDGALFEVLHHKTRFLERTLEPKVQFDLRTYLGRIDSPMHDIRGGWPLIHDPDSYVHSQAFATRLRGAGSNGIAFDSVRRRSAQNLAVFRPSILAGTPKKPHVTQGAHVRVEWDGTRMSRYIVMGEASWNAL
jgi:hypothetical protein